MKTLVHRGGARCLAVFSRIAALLGLAALLAGCATGPNLPPAPQVTPQERSMVEYVIGPGDNLNISVWQQADLSASVPVRPDGKVTLPLVEDMQAAGKTPTRLARDIEQALGEFIREPRVTVIVTSVAEAEKREQVRVIGQAMSPSAVAYRDGMSVLDVMIAVGGLTDFAAGNRAILIRVIDGERREFNLRLNDLVNRGDMSADVTVLPGDVIVIPESRF